MSLDGWERKEFESLKNRVEALESLINGMRKISWLIEIKGEPSCKWLKDEPVYGLYGMQNMEATPGTFTEDSATAKKYSTRASANRAINKSVSLQASNAIATEHMFMQNPVPDDAASEGKGRG